MIKKIEIKKYCGLINIFLVKTYRKNFSNTVGTYKYITYDYMLIYSDIDGTVYEELKDSYLIKRFLINKKLI